MLIGPPRCDSHVTGQQRVSNRFIFRSGRCRPISDTKLDSLVSFLAEETSRLPSFRRRKVTKKRKNASSYPFSPLSLPFLFSLQKFYPSSLLSFFLFSSFLQTPHFNSDSLHLDEIDSFLPPRKFEGLAKVRDERDIVDKIRRVCGAEREG